MIRVFKLNKIIKLAGPAISLFNPATASSSRTHAAICAGSSNGTVWGSTDFIVDCGVNSRVVGHIFYNWNNDKINSIFRFK